MQVKNFIQRLKGKIDMSENHIGSETKEEIAKRFISEIWNEAQQKTNRRFGYFNQGDAWDGDLASNNFTMISHPTKTIDFITHVYGSIQTAHLSRPSLADKYERIHFAAQYFVARFKSRPSISDDIAEKIIFTDTPTLASTFVKDWKPSLHEIPELGNTITLPPEEKERNAQAEYTRLKSDDAYCVELIMQGITPAARREGLKNDLRYYGRAREKTQVQIGSSLSLSFNGELFAIQRMMKGQPTQSFKEFAEMQVCAQNSLADAIKEQRQIDYQASIGYSANFLREGIRKGKPPTPRKHALQLLGYGH